jgi:hypothetical protein
VADTQLIRTSVKVTMHWPRQNTATMDGVTRQLLCGCLRKMHKPQNYRAYLQGTRLVREVKISRASDDALSESLLLALFIYFLIYPEKNISWTPQNAFGTGGNTMRESCWLCAVGAEPVVSGCTGLVAALDE